MKILDHKLSQVVTLSAELDGKHLVYVSYHMPQNYGKQSTLDHLIELSISALQIWGIKTIFFDFPNISTCRGRRGKTDHLQFTMKMPFSINFHLVLCSSKKYLSF